MKKFKTITTFLMLVISAFSGKPLNAQPMVPAAAIAENKVAVLPIVYVGDGNPVKMEEMKYRLQTLAVNYLKKDAVELKFLDPAETNAILLRNGVNSGNFR